MKPVLLAVTLALVCAPAIAAPHFKLRPRGDVRDFLTAYAKAGGPHHNAVCFGDARPRIMAAARLLKADYCEV